MLCSSKTAIAVVKVIRSSRNVRPQNLHQENDGNNLQILMGTPLHLEFCIRSFARYRDMGLSQEFVNVMD